MVDNKKTFDEWLAEAEWPTPEETAQFEAERKAIEGKWFETVTMEENGTLLIITSHYFIGGGSSQNGTESAPGDPDYEELLHNHGRLVPGKAHTLVRKKVDDKWVVLPESDEIVPYRPNDTKTA